MPIIAYLTNQFPSPVEPYVMHEIDALRRRGVTVIPCSGHSVDSGGFEPKTKALASETLYLAPYRVNLLLRAAWFSFRHFGLLQEFILRVLFRGTESPLRRLRALLHTWLGVYYALLLEGQGVEHIHVHHGYFASWVAMVAARVLGIKYSVTLHGSDILLHRAYLDTKLTHCDFCLTVSEFNRRHILKNYRVEPGKVIVQRLGAPVSKLVPPSTEGRDPARLLMLAVGRLHAVKDHAFLLRACRALKRRGTTLLCMIAGEGPERKRLQRMIRRLDLEQEVTLLGHVPRERLDRYYAIADLVVLTSRSEGIPLTLMEAMALGKIVLAPAITGIPELVVHGDTGFLYRPGSLASFVTQVEMIHDLRPALHPLATAARQHVLKHFNQETNLAEFCDLFLSHVQKPVKRDHDADSVLQQV